jgi:hypothetical protein
VGGGGGENRIDISDGSKWSCKVPISISYLSFMFLNGKKSLYIYTQIDTVDTFLKKKSGGGCWCGGDIII